MFICDGEMKRICACVCWLAESTMLTVVMSPRLVGHGGPGATSVMVEMLGPKMLASESGAIPICGLAADVMVRPELSAAKMAEERSVKTRATRIDPMGIRRARRESGTAGEAACRTHRYSRS